MITYEINQSIIDNEEKFNEIFFSRSVRYKTFDLDYKTHFKSYLIVETIKQFISNQDNLSISNRDMALAIFNKYVGSVLRECIECESNIEEHILGFLPDYASIDESINALKIYSQKGGITEWLANLELNTIKSPPTGETYESLLKPISLDIIPFNGLSKVSEKKREELLELLSFFSIIDTEIIFKDYLPETIYSQIENLVNTGLTILAKGYNTEIPRELLNNIQYKKANPTDLRETPFMINSIEGIRIIHKTVVIDGFEFKSIKDSKFLKEILSFNDRVISLSFCFKNCYFNSDSNALLMTFGNLYFLNCRFDKIFRGGIVLQGNIEFNGCVFRGKLDLDGLQFNSMSGIYIEHCFFENGSCCNLSNINGVHEHTKFLCIKNTFFNGELELKDIKNDFYIKMENISFGRPFQIKNIKLSQNSAFDNLTFSSIPSIQMDNSRKDLYNVMKNAGFEERAKELGILPEKIGENDTEEREYQDALQKGWLNPKQAARFLGKSVRTLQEKRKNDQMKITKESLPFKGIGRDIVYPLDALKAYLEQDWNLLKELRKKYWKK